MTQRIALDGGPDWISLSPRCDLAADDPLQGDVIRSAGSYGVNGVGVGLGTTVGAAVGAAVTGAIGAIAGAGVAAAADALIAYAAK